ncbi:D-glucuronyl C5-epimerase family protein [Bosea sp. (in: a-proteobacteria)]|uniref:D-glucuronyl C5-epimerase family protein n=1 Tax=Bosea sp. (in: a-proteobacteria) TaxID=1871050 RepID=UPI0026336203|nr:D-glucuronyl C5-epimerase family protein [Bosea sp. (in: a-proteobacteria)]MCO5092074.1 hypothetical protein [Bosea sp. (in: a-proteobacteria)]
MKKPVILVVAAVIFAVGAAAAARYGLKRYRVQKPLVENVVFPKAQETPRRAGLTLTYSGNHFSTFARDAIFTFAKSSHGGPELLNVLNTYLAPGDQLRIEDNELFDFEAGTTFLKVTRLSDSVTGYVPLETIVGETTLEGVTAIPFERSSLLPTLNISRAAIDEALATLNDGDYDKAFSAGEGKGIHPVIAGTTAMVPLLGAFTSECVAACRTNAQAAGRRFFDLYGFPKASRSAIGAAWAYEFDWPMHWGITLKAPWYSGYANSVMALNAAAMFKLTGEERYRDLARDAVKWLLTPTSQGGALYISQNREFIAEYAYAPGVPNVRVFDGEMKSILSLYNVAVILEDGALLRRSYELSENFATITAILQTGDGLIVNARYPWLVDSPGYTSLMKLWASQLSAVSKNDVLRAAAAKWRKANAVWE